MYKSTSTVMVAAKWTAAAILAQWAAAPQALHVLMGLMLLDYVTGVGASFVQSKVSSAAGARGLVKKAMTLGVILLAHVLEKAFGLELGAEKILALAYCANEAISVVENAASAGVPIPAQLVTALLSVKSLKTASKDEIEKLKGTNEPTGV